MVDKGAEPKAIFDCLKLRESSFAGSLSAVKRMVARIKAEKPVEPEDVAIPVRSAAGEIAQVDFGYVGRLYDAAAGVLDVVISPYPAVGQDHAGRSAILGEARSQQGIQVFVHLVYAA